MAILGLDKLLDDLTPAGREEVAWPTVAAILTIARFCEPQSELHIESTWYRGTALEDLFEGQGKSNPLAKRGYSRDSRPDCLQVCIGLVVTEDGIPLGYEVFAGNRHDSTTVEEIVEAMEKKYGRAHRVWVMDRGMVSEENLKYLRGRGGQYIVGTPKAMLRQFEEHLTAKDWREVQEGVEVKLVPGPQGEETFVLARSADRREKEQAMHERFRERLEKALQADAVLGRVRSPERRERGQSAAGATDATILARGGRIRREDRTLVAAAGQATLARRLGPAIRAGTTGPRSPKAVICSAPISAKPIRRCSGNATSS